MIRALDSERDVIGWMLCDPQISKQGVNILFPHAFYEEPLRAIFEVMVHLVKMNAPVDYITVKQELEVKGEWGKVAEPIKACMTPQASLDHFEFHASRVRSAYYARQIVAKAIALKETPEDLTLVESLQRLALARASEGAEGYFNFSKDLPAYIDAIQTPAAKVLINTGFPGLDELLGGLKQGDLMTVSARPGGGKTAFATKIATNVADAGLTVFFFTTEMQKYQFVNRVMPFKARIPAWRFRKSLLEADHWTQLNDTCSNMNGKFNLWISDKPRPGLGDIKKAAVKIKPQLMIVDYLQRCEKPSGENVTRATDAFMGGLKTIAIEHGLVMILGCQMNRSVDREEKPRLSDLRDSGAIEAESDQVLLLHNTNKEKDLEKLEITGLLEKNRHGWNGTANFVLDRNYVELMENENESSSDVGPGSRTVTQGGSLRAQGQKSSGKQPGNNAFFGGQSNKNDPAQSHGLERKDKLAADAYQSEEYE